MQRTPCSAIVSIAVGVLLACAASGCGGGGSGSPSAASVAGEWNGAWLSANGIDNGAFSLSLNQSGASVGGQASFDGSSCFSGGVFSGSVSGAALHGSVADAVVRVTVDASITGSAMNGTYSVPSGGACTGDSGTFALSNKPPPTPSNRLYVRTSGSDSNTGANPAIALRSISKAADISRSGSTVVVGPGTYPEGVTTVVALQDVTFLADPSGQLTGDAPGAVVLDGTAAGEEAGFNLSNASGTLIDGFTISGFSDAGVLIKGGSDNLRVQQCVIFGNASDGIRVQDSANVLVFNNLIYGNGGSGVAIAGATSGSPNAEVINNTIVGNQVRGLTVGTSTRASPGAFVHNNIIQDNGQDVSIKVFAPPPSGVPNSNVGYQGDFNLVLPSAYLPSTIKGRHDIALDAQFVNADAGDFHLRGGSPAINAGDSLNGLPDLRAILRTLTTTGGTACDKSALDLGYHYPAARCTAAGP
jgi:parallel beta-helix repeat protein